MMVCWSQASETSVGRARPLHFDICELGTVFDTSGSVVVQAALGTIWDQHICDTALDCTPVLD